MTVLGIDVSGQNISLGLCEGQRILHKLSFKPPSRMEKTLLPSIYRLLARAGKKPDSIVVTEGPGRFTGLRLGLTIGAGLSSAFSARFYLLSCFDIIKSQIPYDKKAVLAISGPRQWHWLRFPDNSLHSGSIKELMPLIKSKMEENSWDLIGGPIDKNHFPDHKVHLVPHSSWGIKAALMASGGTVPQIKSQNGAFLIPEPYYGRNPYGL